MSKPKATPKPKKLSATKKKPYVMQGGPLDKQTLYLETPGTMPFRLKGQYGRYNERHQWVAL